MQRMTRIGPAWLLALALTACGASRLATAQASSLPTGQVGIGAHVVHVEVAATPATRERGLMQRQALPDGTGMLFVFPDRAPRVFWMRDTPLPLSIAYLDDDGTIVRLADMAPMSETLHPSVRPARYALEVRLGWFAEQGIVEGQHCRLQLPDDLLVY